MLWSLKTRLTFQVCCTIPTFCASPNLQESLKEKGLKFGHYFYEILSDGVTHINTQIIVESTRDGREEFADHMAKTGTAS